MLKTKLIRKLENYLFDCEKLSKLLRMSTSVVDRARKDEQVRLLRKSLIGQTAELELYLHKYGQSPHVKDPVWQTVYSVYDNAFADDVPVRVGRSLDAVIDDVTYAIAKVKIEKKSLLYEESGPTGSTTVSPRVDAILHPKIMNLCEKRVQAGHYADAVEAAFKEVNSRIKLLHKARTGIELDGAALMNAALSLNTPTLVLGDLSTQSGKDLQLGYMQIFAGTMTGERNPAAHENREINEKESYRLLVVASQLMYKIDGAQAHVV